jgi:predicted nucleotidyltransferase component of viral defense system
MKHELHEQFMVKILLDIYKNKLLSKYLYFKGGTAFYLFYDLPRFSTDLDFDISAKCENKEGIFDELKRILAKYGEIKDARIKMNTVFLVLSYKKHERLIKIEASKRNFLENFEIKNIFGVDIKLLNLDLLCSHKLVALTERIKARDLFDAYFIFLNKFPINEEILKTRTNKNHKEFLKYLKNKIDKNFTRKNVLQELGEVIDENKKIWIKDHLKNEVIKMIDKNLAI